MDQATILQKTEKFEKFILRLTTVDQIKIEIPKCKSYRQLMKNLGFLSKNKSRECGLRVIVEKYNLDVSHFVRDSIKSLSELLQARETFDKRMLLKHSKQRFEGTHLSKYILKDSRKSDKKKGLENNLTKEFIELSFKEATYSCLYCEEKELKLTLDRIDNSKGHLQNNVNVCCIRCNFFRRDMPYDAWQLILPGLRDAREQGLLGDWISGGRNKSKFKP